MIGVSMRVTPFLIHLQRKMKRISKRHSKNASAIAAVVSENANGAASSNPRGVLEIRGDQPTRNISADS